MLLTGLAAFGQDRMTLSEAIRTARTNSVEALETRQAFISTYWAYRSYKASRLPSFYLSGDIMNFDRSLTLLQNPETGILGYVSSNNLQNGLGLEIIRTSPSQAVLSQWFLTFHELTSSGQPRVLHGIQDPSPSPTISPSSPTTSSNGTKRSNPRNTKKARENIWKGWRE